MILSQNKATRLLALLLAALVVLTTAACKSDVQTDLPTDVTTEAPSTEAAVIAFSITSEYQLVRREDAADEELKAISLLNRGIKSATGASPKLNTDWVKRGEEVKPAQYEILIGPTNRTQSQEVYSNLSRRDYTYEIISENVIVICGGCPEATLEAARAFLRDIFGYEEGEGESVLSKGTNAALTAGTSYTFRNEYPVKTITLGGYSIKDFKIVSPSGADAGTEVIIAAFAELCGYNIPVISPEDYKEGTPAIFFGCADASGKHLDRVFDSYSYYITTNEGQVPQLIIDTTSSSAKVEAARRFIKLYLDGVEPTAEIKLDISTKFIAGAALGNEVNNLEFIKIEETTTVADGITYEKRLYHDQNGKPVRAYVLTVAPGKGIFYTGTADDAYVLTKGAGVSSQMSAAKSNGKKVVGGVNADFYNMSTFLPSGLCIKEGQVLRENTNSQWFAMLKDGTPIIANSADYAKYEGNIRTAVGGRYIVLTNGRIGDVAMGNDFGYTRHPRTAVGIKEDGTVVLVVVDGRQPSISNGASLGDLALIFRELGCIHALNLDGGGSSTFVTANTSGNFTVHNSPSDGSQRRVANSLLVLLPE